MSELIEQLASDLGITVRPQGGLRLIRSQDCEEIVQACKSNALLILGIEAFILTDGKVVPEMELIADYSELASKDWDAACFEAAQSAESYFGQAKDRTELWFDFCLKRRCISLK